MFSAQAWPRPSYQKHLAHGAGSGEERYKDHHGSGLAFAPIADRSPVLPGVLSVDSEGPEGRLRRGNTHHLPPQEEEETLRPMLQLLYRHMTPPENGSGAVWTLCQSLPTLQFTPDLRNEGHDQEGAQL